MTHAGRHVLRAAPLLAAALLTLGGCGKEPAAPRGDGAQARAPEELAPDSPPPARPTVVSLAPNVTELLFAMGQGDHLVGRSRYCTFPAEATSLPIVGDARDLNVEKVLTLAPDLAVFNTSQARFYDRLTSAGIRCLAPRMETVAEVFSVIDLLGREFTAEGEAAAFAARLRAELEAVGGAARGAERVRVLVTFPDTLGGGGEVLVVGRETFVDELIDLAGGTNVVGSSGYPRASIETAVKWAPEVILISAPGDIAPGKTDEAYRSTWTRWESIPAVRDGRVVVRREPYLTIPGARMGQATLLMLRVLHPQRAATVEAAIGSPGTPGGTPQEPER